MSLIPVLGMDPSLNSWGLAKGWYDTDSGRLSIEELSVINPEFNNGKQVRQNSKDLERATQLTAGVVAASQGVTAIFVEVPVGSQSARAMASYAICVGILGAMRAGGINFFEVTPTEVKMATMGNKTASKKQIIARAVGAHPDANWPYTKKNGTPQINATKAEHMADAIGSIEAGILTNPFKQILPFLNAA